MANISEEHPKSFEKVPFDRLSYVIGVWQNRLDKKTDVKSVNIRYGLHVASEHGSIELYNLIFEFCDVPDHLTVKEKLCYVQLLGID